MIQDFSQPLHDRKAQPKAASFRPVGPLIVLMEYVRQLVFGDADATIPDFNAHIVASPPTSEQNSSSVGVSDRIRQQVAHHLREHVPVTANDELGTDDAQSEPSFLHKRDEICSEWLQDFIERKVAHRRTQVSGFQPVHVEQARQDAAHGVQRLPDSIDKIACLAAWVVRLKRRLQEFQGLQWLSQVMACGGKKARFGAISQFC